MKFRTLRAALAATCIVGFVGALTAVPAVSAPPIASGTETCQIQGMGKFSPKLLATGTVPAVKFVFKAKASSCNGTAMIPGALAQVVSAKLKGSGYLFDSSAAGLANGCTQFTTTDELGAATVKVGWAATPAIAPTTINYTTGTSPVASNNAGNVQLTFPSGPAPTLTGSFQTSPPTTVLTLVLNIPFTCSATWGPYGAFTIMPGSTLVIP